MLVGSGNSRDVMETAGVESRGAKNQNRGIDKERKAQGKRGIEDRVTHRFPPVTCGNTEGARLHDAGVKIEIVGHYGGPKDANGDVQHFAVAKDFGARDEADGGFAPKRMREKNLVSETSSNRRDERNYKGLDQAKAPPLQGQHDENVQSGDEHAGQKRQTKEKLQRHGRAQHLGEIAGGDGDFTDHP